MSSEPAPTILSRRCPSCGGLFPYDEEHRCPNSDARDTLADSTLPRQVQVTVQAEGDLVGLILGERYAIEERLSAGGMGVVYRARHTVLDSPVAVKILRRTQDPEAQRRFLLEARLASLIRHPNTVYISDFGVLKDGRSYIVMEFLSGPTLSKVQRSSGGRLSPSRACQIALQIAQGLESVHAKGIVHRDLKPDNIFVLRSDGSTGSGSPGKEYVKIVDFGIAVAAGPGLYVDSRSGASAAGGDSAAAAASSGPDPSISTDKSLAERFTMPGTILGTPHYMSPEQANEGDVDARSDQYALGCILYELLTGTVPFDHPSNPTAILIQHARNPVEPPRKRCPEAEIPEGVEAIVLRMLAKKREERFDSMAEVAAALQRELATLQPDDGTAMGPGSSGLLSGPTRALSGPTAGQSRLSTQVVLRPRRWHLLVFAGFAVLLVAGSGYIGYRQWQLSKRDRPRAVTAQLVRELRQKSTEVLAGQLRAREREVRLGALQALGRTQDVGARTLIEPLLQAAGNEPAVQSQAAEALGQLGDRQALPALAAALEGSRSASARAAIADAMDQLDDERGQRVLLEMLDGQDEEARFRAAYLLCRKGNRKAVAVLSGLIERAHPPEDILLDALARLAQAGEDSARQKLAQRLATADSRPRQLPIAFRLAQLGDDRGLKLLRDLAEHPGREQLLAARLLAAVEHPDVAKLFRQVLTDPQANAASQATATEGLGLAGELPDVLLLRPKLDPPQVPASGSEGLRQLAAAAVLQLVASDPSVMTEQGMGWARGALSDSNWIVRESAAAVLGDLPADQATQLLGQMLKDSDLRVRRGAVRSLGKKPGRPALLALREALYDREAAVRSEALKAILRVGKTLQQQGKGAGAAGLAGELTGWFKDILGSGPPAEQVLARSVLRKLGDASQDSALSGFRAAPDRELRRILLEQADSTTDSALLVSALSDSDPALRLLAARRLGERGDQRATPVLREALGRGGSDGIVAFGMLRKLGQAVDLPPNVEKSLSSPNVEDRLLTVESFGKLPPELAVPLLLEAARDPERLVRRLVAEVAADLPDGPQGPAGLPVLRLLQRDLDASVRFRVQALVSRFGDLSRFASARKPEPVLAPPPPRRTIAVEPTPDMASPPSSPPDAGAPDLLPAASPAPSTATGNGSLLIRPSGAQFQLDKRPWQVATDKPLELPAGPHRLNALSGEQKIDIAEHAVLTVELPESAIEKSAHAGLAAFEKRDYSKALRLLAKAASDCEKRRKLAQPCAALSSEMYVRIGEVYEKQDQIVEAAGEYQSALQVDPERRGRAELRTAAEQGLARLGKQLGRITLPKTDRGGKCREVTQWVLPGNQIVSKDGQSQMVKVRPGETINLGGCP